MFEDGNPCPECGQNHANAMDFEGNKREAPKPGDATICNQCAAILVFKKDLSLRKTKAKEFDKWSDDEVLNVLSGQRQILEMNERILNSDLKKGIIGMALLLKGGKIDSHGDPIKPYAFYRVEKIPELGKTIIEPV